MTTITISGFGGDFNRPISVNFHKLTVACVTPYCKKGFDLVAGEGKRINPEFEEVVVSRKNGVLFFTNPKEALCPYCKKETAYSYCISLKDNECQLQEVSENVIALLAFSPCGEIRYVRKEDTPSDDPSFNFVDNINKNRPAYFYNEDDPGDGVTVMDAHFIKEGDSCVVTLVPNDDGFTTDIVVNGPLAVLKQAILVVSNHDFFVCDEVRSHRDEILISPGNDNAFFSNKVVICRQNSPVWTRILQEANILK